VGLRGTRLLGIGGNSTLMIFRLYYAYPKFSGLLPPSILWRQSGIFWIYLCLLFTRYYPVDQITKNEMGRACGTRGGEERCMQDLVDITDGKRPFGRLKLGWEDNIKMDVLKDVDWFDLAQDSYRWHAVMNAVTNIRVP
jgi:hypothetical protein